jgi:8-oxo-dGTP pyrophosphatase MutT (NUDIX family)
VALPIGVRRLAYRSAHAALRGYWFVAHPDIDGVKCVLIRGDRILFVRHTYGHRGWDLPGGSVKRGEPPLTTAGREMEEELGVEIDDWRPLGVVTVYAYHRRDSMHVFQAELGDRPLTVDRGEIGALEFFHPDRLPADLAPHVPQILARVEH